MSSDLPGPEAIHRQRLANGLTVLTLQRPGLPFVTLRVEVAAGSGHDPRDGEGLAAMTAETLTRGTRRRDPVALYEEVDRLGMQLDAGAGGDFAQVGIRALREDLEAALAILAEVLEAPAFLPTEVDKVRGETLTRIQEAEDDTGHMAERTLAERLYPSGHPYHHPVYGYRQTVAQFSSGDLAAFYQARYRPERAVAALVGDLEPAEALQVLDRTLGAWRVEVDGAADPHGGPEENGSLAINPPEPSEVVRVPVPGKSQADIALGRVTLARTDEDYDALFVANLILGRMGLGGRIGRKVRDRQGMAYYSFSTLGERLRPALWMVRAGVAPENVERAVESIREELDRIAAEGVEEQELADARSFLLGSLPLRVERAGGMVALLLAIERYGLGLDYLQRYAGIIEGVGPDDLQQAARRYFQSRHCLVVVAGPGE